MTYDVDYFIIKFQAIPDSRWITGNLSVGDMHCALGHCGVKDYEQNNEAIALSELLYNLYPQSIFHGDYDLVYEINDGAISEYSQESPKLRILAALHDIKKMQDGQVTSPVESVKVVTKYVSVPQSITEQSKNLVLS